MYVCTQRTLLDRHITYIYISKTVRLHYLGFRNLVTIELSLVINTRDTMSKKAAGGLLTLGSLLFIILSLSVFILKNVLISGWTADKLTVTPFRWVAATLVPVISASWGHGKNFTTSGALVALMVGFILTLANYSFFLSLLAFFVSSNRAMKYKEEVKKTLDETSRAGSRRNWLDILCSSGMALELCLLYLIDIGSADLPIDFR